MMCNELHRCMHHAHNSPFESCQNVPAFVVRVLVMWFHGVTLWEEKSYVNFAQKMNNK